MYQDPIVKETRKAGEDLAKRVGYDLHRFFEELAILQKTYGDRLVNKLGQEETPIESRKA